VLLLHNLAYSQFAAKGLTGHQMESVTIDTREVEDLMLIRHRVMASNP